MTVVWSPNDAAMVQMMVRPYLGTPAWCCLTCRPLLELVLVSTQRRTFPLGQVLWYSGYCRAHVLFFYPFILSLQLFAPFYLVSGTCVLCEQTVQAASLARPLTCTQRLL